MSEPVAGPELDAWIAANIFFIDPERFKNLYCFEETIYGRTHILGAGYHYSTSIAAAWEVVERMQALGSKPWLKFVKQMESHEIFGARANEMAMLICLAAKEAVSDE